MDARNHVSVHDHGHGRQVPDPAFCNRANCLGALYVSYVVPGCVATQPLFQIYSNIKLETAAGTLSLPVTDNNSFFQRAAHDTDSNGFDHHVFITGTGDCTGHPVTRRTGRYSTLARYNNWFAGRRGDHSARCQWQRCDRSFVSYRRRF